MQGRVFIAFILSWWEGDPFTMPVKLGPREKEMAGK